MRLKQNRKSPGWFYGLGFWTRGNAEVCLLATRGRPRRQAANIHQFIISPVEAHSKKPDEARDKIVAYSGPPQSRKTLWGEEEGRRGYGGSAIGGNGMQRVSSDEDVPRVELFARQTPSGWDVWGNEVEPSAGLRDTLSHSTQTGGVV